MKIPSTANYLNQTRENLRKNPFVAQKFRSTAMKRDFALVPGNSGKFKLRGAQTIIRGFLRGRMFSWKLLKETFHGFATNFDEENVPSDVEKS